MSGKIFILVAFCLIQIVRVYSQTPSYYHYASSDGLASSTIYDIIQDRNGFVWFATINGISKFDGKEFITYRTPEGLNSNSITSLLEGKDGELYFGNYEKGINVLRNGQISNYCSEIKGKSFATSYLLITSEGKDKQKMYTYRSWGSINIIKEEKTAGLITYSISSSPNYINKLEVLPNNEMIALTLTGLFAFRNDKLVKLRISGLPDNPLYCLTAGDDGSYFVGAKGMIYQIKNNSVVRQFKVKLSQGNNDVIALLRDKNKNLWFSVMNRGFFLIPIGSDKISDVGITMGLQNTLVNKYLEDNEGNIWLSTFGKGVYCLNNLYLKTYSESDGLSNNNVYSVLKESQGRLLIGTFNGINLMENGKFHQIRSYSDKTLTEYIYHIKNVNKNFYICGAFGENVIKNISYKDMHFHLFNGPSFCITNNGFYLYGTGGNALNIQKGPLTKTSQSKRYYLFGDGPDINRINDIFEDSDKNVWIGTGLGLCKISNFSDQMTNWKKSFFPADHVLCGKINSIFQDDYKKVWFAGENGIARIDLMSDSVKSYTKIGELDLSSSTQIVADSRKRIWIGNMKGLFLLDGDSIKLYNRQTGLPSDEVYSLF